MSKRSNVLVLGILFFFALCAGCGKKEATASDIFDTILSARNENETYVVHDIGWKEGIQHYFDKETLNEEITSGYVGETYMESEADFVCQIDWLKTEDGSMLENFSFDFKDYAKKAGCQSMDVFGVFYEDGTVWMLVGAGGLDEPYTMLVEFTMENPEKYEITEYAGISSWWGQCVRSGDKILIHNNDTTGKPVWEIDTNTKEAYYSEAEFAMAESVAVEFVADYAGADKPYVTSFFATDFGEDVVVYTAYVNTGNDVLGSLQTIHLVYEERELQGIMAVDETTGEVDVRFTP